MITIKKLTTEHEEQLYNALFDLVEAITVGVTTETFLACANEENSCLFNARKALGDFTVVGPEQKFSIDF